jgi:hypothetical protein
MASQISSALNMPSITASFFSVSAVFYHTFPVILGQVFHRPLRLFALERTEMGQNYLERKVVSGS